MIPRVPKQFLDIAHDFHDAPFFFQDAGGELFWRQVHGFLLGARVFAVEIAAGCQQFGGGDFPCVFVFLAFFPPGDERREFLELEGRGLGVVFAAFGERVFVIPNLARRAGAVEEQKVGRNGGIGREYAIGQADDGVQIEFLQKVFLDAGAHAVAEQGSIGHDHRGARRAALAAQFPHDELQEQERGFRRLLVFGEIALNALFFLAAKRRIGENDIHAVAFAHVGELMAQRVAGIDARSIQAMQQQVHLAEQIRERFGFAAEEGLFLQSSAVGHGFDLLFQMPVGFDEKTAGAACRIEHGLAQARIGHGDHQAHHGARGVELAGVARRVAHFAEHGFIERAQGVQFLAGSEMNAADLVDDVAQQVAAFHAVVHALEHGGNDVAPVVAVAGERAQVTEKPRAPFAVTVQQVL